MLARLHNWHRAGQVLWGNTMRHVSCFQASKACQPEAVLKNVNNPIAVSTWQRLHHRIQDSVMDRALFIKCRSILHAA